MRGATPSFSTDVFSLGIILNWLFQGPRFANDIEGDALLAAVRSGEVVRPIFAPILPQELASILHRALSVRAADRYPNAVELARELRSVLLSANIPDHRGFVREAIRSDDLARTIESGPSIDVDVDMGD